jgi:hypothetical protein
MADPVHPSTAPGKVGIIAGLSKIFSCPWMMARTNVVEGAGGGCLSNI